MPDLRIQVEDPAAPAHQMARPIELIQSDDDDAAEDDAADAADDDDDNVDDDDDVDVDDVDDVDGVGSDSDSDGLGAAMEGLDNDD